MIARLVASLLLLLTWCISAYSDEWSGRPASSTAIRSKYMARRSRLWGIDAPESTQFCRGEDSLPYPMRGKFCERCPMSAIEFPFESNQDVIAKSERGQFPAKVFSLVHQFGGLDFAVVVDSNGGTHHKFFRELEAAAPIS